MKTKSEFDRLDIGDEGHTLAVELVHKAKTVRAIYVVFDGQRIARRSSRATWISMMPGFEVVDNADLTALTVYVEGRPLHGSLH
jgi:hypothetical protein